MDKLKLKVDNISCSNCANTIKRGLDEYDVDVNINNSTVYIKGEKLNEKEIKKQLKNIGYPVVEQHNKMKYKVILSTALSIPLLVGMFNHFTFSEMYIPDILSNGYLQLILATIIQVVVGKDFYISAYKSLRQKVLGMDMLVVISTTTAYLYSLYLLLTSSDYMTVLYFETGALILTIVTIGKYIEHNIKLKTSDAINELVDLGVKQANLVIDDEVVLVDVEKLKIGDVVKVMANEKIPIDGVITSGSTYVNESSFTGESRAIKKAISSNVIGGSINISNEITIKVSKIGSDTLLSQIITAVEEASLIESKYQKLADKISAIFIPIVLIIAILTFIINFVISGDGQMALFNTLSVLLISCPCALGLATPTAIMSANGVSVKRGILYKGGNFFELAYKIDTICFDKTGTLTKGEPEVITYNISEEFNDLVYSISSYSNHPISKAVHNYLNATKIDLGVEHIDGIGLKTLYNNQEVFICNERAFDFLLPLKNTGNYLVIDNKVIGYYEVEDELKESSIEVIAKLKEQGIKPVMITGDNYNVALSIANKLQIEEFYAEVLPVDKSNIVKNLQKNKIVGFVGDGVNDSVALTQADIGISVNNGNDIAIMASDVTLMHDDLSLILDGIKISKLTNRNIKQNLFWAFSYNLIAIPLAATGNLNMYVAAISMGLSSIFVISNALRLKRIKFDTKLYEITNVDIHCDKCVSNISKLLVDNNITEFKVDKDKKVVYVSDKKKALKILKENNYV